MKRSHIWGVVFCGSMSLFMGFLLAQDIIGYLAARSWVPIEATVVDITNYPKGATLTYEYVYDGMKLRGDRLAFLSEGNFQDKDYINENFVVGQKITVFVNPSNPKQSVVVRRQLRLIYLWKSLFVGVVSGVIALYDFRKLYHRPPGHDRKEELPSQ